jgi:hypothetical protein
MPARTKAPGSGRRATLRRPQTRSSSLLAKREPVEPEGCVVRILRAYDSDPQVGDCEQATPYRVRVPRSRVDIRTLDEEEGKHRSISDPSDLRPKPAPSQRAVEVGDGLALDEDAAADAVVA